MTTRDSQSLLSADALKQAAWYAAAFGATATLATSADAQVLYGDPADFTAQSTYMDLDGDGTLDLAGIPLDLDQDGDPELFFTNRGADQGTSYTLIFGNETEEDPSGDFLSNLVGLPVPFNGVDYPYFAPLSAGYVLPDDVGLDNDFFEGGATFGTFTFAGSNPLEFPVDEDAYIGIEFTLDDTNVHYGWVRLQLLSGGGFLVKDYGFNATPGGSIAVGEIGEPLPIAIEDDFDVRGYAVRTVGANPFSTAGTKLQVEVAQAEQVRAEVYNALGQRVEVLYSGALAGERTFQFGSGYAAGLYVVRVTGETFQQTIKVTRN